ncbi:MAG TPA: O-antigen ligase family protein [Polyangiaceae bacterium]|jgi:O-antigen ligase|nr:O-antigen ligase family protein [Polyangiaceae bacterium]
MFAIPGIIALVVFIYARPQEFVERLRVVPFLYVFFVLALSGGLLDLRVRNLRLASTPQLPWIVAFFLWSSFTVLVHAPSSAASPIMGLLICIALYLLIAHGVQGFRALHVVAGSVLAMVLLVCGVGAHQGFAPSGCVVIDQNADRDTASGKPDGRPCDTIRSCYVGDTEPGAEYACEHIGLFGTTSIGGGRVRYRGVLQDPNELALAGGVGLPLAFAFGQVRRKRFGQRLVTWAAFALVLLCAVLTGSRGGQLVFATVLAAYFARRFGARGLIIGGALALPLLLLGGRSGAEATSSTNERLDLLVDALSMWRSHPILGVGLGQFTEWSYMTAHNSYLLALAELGFPGMVLFSIILYLSAKTPLVALRTITPEGGSVAAAGEPLVRPWAMAMLAAFAGLTVGIFFLSFTYHYVLWIYIGLSGAFYSAIHAHYPGFRVKFGARDLALVVALDLAVIVFVFLYTKWALR